MTRTQATFAFIVGNFIVVLLPVWIALYLEDCNAQPHPVPASRTP